MKHGLILGLDGAGKTLLLRQLALQLLKSHRGVVDRLVALAQSASCISSMSTDAVVPRGTAGGSSPSSATATAASLAQPHVAASGSSPAASGPLSANGLIQNALNFAANYPTLTSSGAGGGAGAAASNDGDQSAHFSVDTQPTIGVEHTPLTIEGKTFSICEVGGQLLPMWKAYFDASEFWIYVIDISTPSHVAGAVIEFFNIMRVESMRRKPKLLLLNKIDSCFTLDDALLRSYLNLDQLLTDAYSSSSISGPMHVMKISAASGENTDGVLKWISQRWHSTNTPSGPSPAHLAAGFVSRVSVSRNEKQRVHPVAR